MRGHRAGMSTEGDSSETVLGPHPRERAAAGPRHAGGATEPMKENYSITPTLRTP